MSLPKLGSCLRLQWGLQCFFFLLVGGVNLKQSPSSMDTPGTDAGSCAGRHGEGVAVSWLCPCPPALRSGLHCRAQLPLKGETEAQAGRWPHAQHWGAWVALPTPILLLEGPCRAPGWLDPLAAGI